MKKKFDFFEIAKICSVSRLKKFNGLECVIVGSGYDEDTEQWSYAIDVGLKASCAFEYELEKTGKFVNPEDYKSVDSVRLRVLPDGSGEIIEDSEDEKNNK